MMNKNIGIYIHIPFCVSKCIYCDFTSITDKKKIEKYFNYLLEEIKMYKSILKEYKIKTIYIGGGTPSFVNEKYIKKVINEIKKYNDFSDDIEFTIEVNPGSINEEKLKEYISLGINRLSIGLQSTNDNMLKTIGRVHTFHDFKEKYSLARRLGINNISLDLMFGLPSQELNDFIKSIERVIDLSPEHISAYSLKVERGTKLYDLVKNKKLLLPTEELDRKMYEILINKLESNGYNLYEISNFSKKGYESKHNLSYWNRKEYLGLGISAHGFISDERYGNENSFEKYFKKIDQGKKPINEINKIYEDEALFEEIMLNLRLTKGINIEEISRKYSIDFLKEYNEIIEELLNDGLIKIKDNYLFIPKEYLSLSNSIIEKFI